MALFVDTPDLEIRAARHIKEAVADALSQFSKPGNLGRFKTPAERTHPDDEPIARLHRPQRAGTPALDRNCTHDAARSRAAIELRRVCQREASCRRVKQISIAASAAGLSRSLKVRDAALPVVAAS